MTGTPIPPPDSDEPAEATGSAWITRFLADGDRFGRATLSPGQGGVEFSDGRFIIDTVDSLAELGHALVMRFDPPSAAQVEAAGLHRDGPQTWPDVARAALNRPVSVSIASTGTSHYDWVGTGCTDDEARDSLMRAWLRHAEQTGADPTHIRRDELNLRHGVIGTAWRDDDPVPPPPPDPW